MNIIENIWHAKNYYHNVSTCICLSRRKTGLAETAVLQGFETTTFYSLKCGYGLKMDLRERRREGKNDLSLQTALSSSSLSSTGNLHWQIQWLITAPTDANRKIPCGIQCKKDQTPNLDCCQQWGANVSLNRASLVSFLPHVSSTHCQLRAASRLFAAREERGRAGSAKPVESEAVWASWNICSFAGLGIDFCKPVLFWLPARAHSSPGHCHCSGGPCAREGSCAKMWHLHTVTSPKHSLGWVSRRSLSEEPASITCSEIPQDCLSRISLLLHVGKSFPNASAPVFGANKVISEGTRRVLFSL